MNTEQMSVAKVEPKNIVPSISSEVIDQLVDAAKSDVRWIKVEEVGFFDGDILLGKEIRAVVTFVDPYFIQWIKGERRPVKKAFTKISDKPEGFDFRIDLRLLLGNKETVGISLAPSSSKNFTKYVARLKGAGQNVSAMVSLLKVRSVTNREGQRFAIIDFEPATQRQLYQEHDETVTEEEDIPF